MQGGNYEIYANREKTAIDLCDYSIRNHICNGTSDVVWLWKGLNLSAFPNAQMLYPAAGVMMAYLITKKEIKIFQRLLHILCSSHGGAGCLHGGFCSGSQNRDLMSMPYSQWAPIMEYVIIGGSVIFWILLLQSGKEKRRAYGLNSEHWNISIRMILLFIGLYLLRFVIACALSGQLSEFGKIMANPTTWIIFLLFW